jgi:DNA-binding response OmpR family regulator
VFGATQQRKILLIDDSEVVLEVTRAALEGAGHRVVTHDRAAGCVALILQEKPDLVLMDVNMPHLAGDTIVSVLSKAQPTADTVILLYSSLSADVLRAKADAVGAHGFLQKTADQFTLVREVNYWLRRSLTTSSGRMRVAMELGLSPSSGKMRAAPELGAAELRAHTPTVLLMDHDMSVLSSYRRHLQVDPFSVEYALSGSTALRRILSDNPPDVAVCNVMPDFSGMDLYRRALSLALNWRQRIVLTRESEMPASGEHFAGFSGLLLIKPVTAETLRNAVWGCLGHGGVPRAGRAAGQSSSALLAASASGAQGSARLHHSDGKDS